MTRPPSGQKSHLDDLAHPGRNPQTTPRRASALSLIGLWFLILAGFAALAPVAQERLGVPWDVLSLIMLGPAISALVVVLAGRRRLPTPWPAVRARALVSPLVLALLFVVVFTVVLAALAGRAPVLPEQVAGVPLWAFIGLQALGALGEEAGWRGLMQRLGETMAPPPVVTVILGALFGATHLGLWGQGPLFMFWFTLSTVLMSVAIMVTWRGSFWQRMVPAVVIHTGCNLAYFAITHGGTPTGWLVLLPGAAALVAVILARAAAAVVGQRAR